jgi:hypothetical protein
MSSGNFDEETRHTHHSCDHLESEKDYDELKKKINEKVEVAIKDEDRSDDSQTNQEKLKVNPVCESHIKWDQYNWPICFKLIHFNLTEIHPSIRTPFDALYIGFFILFVVLIIKMITHLFIFQRNNINIIFVFVISPILMLLKIISFYSAYRGFFYDDSFTFVFKLTSAIFIIFALVNVGVGGFIFDGIPRILEYVDQDPSNSFALFIVILQFSLNGLFVITEASGITIYLLYENKYGR